MPARHWLKARLRKPKAEFRVMAKCSLDFHVLSTLWMLEVGYLFDAKLTDCSYGNRLRRTKNGERINPLSLGSFSPISSPSAIGVTMASSPCVQHWMPTRRSLRSPPMSVL